MMEVPRYPAVRVTVRTANPIALVSAVRHALRRAGVDRREIYLFSQKALEESNPRRQRLLCQEWAHVEAPPLA